MNKFAKIIQLEDRQIVVMRRSDSERGEHVQVVIPFPFLTLDIYHNFDDEIEMADECFEEMNAEELKHQVDEITAKFEMQK